MCLRQVAGFFLFAVLYLAASTHALVKSRAAYNSGFGIPGSLWKRGHRLPDNEVIRVDFALAIPADNLDTAIQALYDISNPTSPKFGQYWSSKQVATLLMPSQYTIRDVGQWLNDSGIPRSDIRLSSDKGLLYFETTVGHAEQLLDAQYNQYFDGQHVQIASQTYYLPQSIADSVDFVSPSFLLPRPRAFLGSSAVKGLSKSKRTIVPTPIEIDCFEFMNPECLRLLYNIPASTNIPIHPNNSFGIFELSYTTWLPEDLDAFFMDFEPQLVNTRPVIQPIDGGYRQTEFKNDIFNLESNLDFEYAMSLTYPQPVINLQVGSETQVGNTNIMLAAFDKEYCETGLDPEFNAIQLSGNPTNNSANVTDCGTVDPPLVISISYAWNEAAFSERYDQRQCLEYLKLGLQGVTVMAASADLGTADQTRMCRDPLTNSPNATEGLFSAVFPASCPWITAVGATQLSPTNQTWVKGSTKFPPETAFWLNSSGTIYTSGGGFSNVFQTPFYQSAAVEAYLNQPQYKAHFENLSSLRYFDNHGRGYPDVSTTALNCLVISDGQLITVSGTSASTIIFASIVARINNARLSVGKRSVGFLNPVLYEYGDRVMRDVQTGLNTGCGVSEAFIASKGWDAVTGLGTPDFEKLLDLYLSLP
jgi:tripeptidyl-peptidase-1